MGRVLVVFNNRRAGLFLQKQMLSLSEKPFFLPRIIGIDELVSQLGNQQIAPHEFLLFELFDIHRNIEGDERRFETFEEFISFGEMMICDFSEIDLYCIDARQLFNNLSEQKRLGEWDISGAPLTPFQEKYLNFYRSLFDYYTQLHQRLEAQGRAYSGMAYRYVAEHIDSMIESLDYSHIYFVGFNALSACERRIIDCCVKRGIGSLICDGDEYYFDDKRQEAGHFLRENALRFPGIGNFENNFAQRKKTVHILNCPESVLQAKATGQIIKELIAKKEQTIQIQDTAIVLADENMLLPVLNSLPAEVNATNVTMGFPFALTNINNLAIKLFALFCNTRKGRFYYVDVIAVLSDTLLSNYLGTRDLFSKTTNWINQRKAIYLAKDDISLMFRDVDISDKVMFLFENSELSADAALANLRQLFSLLSASDSLGNNVKEKEALACFIQTLNYLDELQEQYHFIERIETLQKIYNRLAQRRSVAFYGEPLQGLQVLGMLETRSLDFNHIVLLSLNEGTLPAGRTNNSLIPLSLKHAFGIPTFQEKDAVYAYNFYRLLQRADDVWLLYSSDAEGLGKGEPSRFILQVKKELAVRYPNITIEEEVVAAYNLPPEAPSGPQRMPKDSRTLKRLKELSENGFSPTALNRYRACPLQFFYSDVLGIWERDDISEELESNELGTFIHNILKDIYSRDTDKTIRATTLEKALDDIDNLVDSRFQSEVLKGRSSEGKNLLYNEVAKLQLKSFLKKEIDILKKGSTIEVKLVEDNMELMLPLQSQGINYPVVIKGIADRVDLINNQMRIADYKSGKVEERELAVSDAAPDPHNVPDKWFQVMTYAWLYCRKHNYSGSFQAGIFPLNALKSRFMNASWEEAKALENSHMERFEEVLCNLMAEILDPQTDFVATPDKSVCRFCPVARICKDKILEKKFF